MWRQPCTHRALRRLLPSSSRGLIASGLVPFEAATARRSLSHNSSLRQGSPFYCHNDVSRWNVTLGHAFSTNVKATEDQQESEASVETLPSEPEAKELSIEDVTSPGQAQQVLCRQKLISTDDFQKLIDTARTGNAQDATVILYCLKHMKVYKGLVLSADTADHSVEKILDCLVGGDNVTPQDKVDAATLILSNFQEDTGLYYALRNYTINKVLRTFWEGVQGGGVATAAASEDLTEDQHPWVVLLHQLIRKLNYRRSRPHLDMKKRAARLYKRHIRQHSGTNQGTIQVATQIALHVASAETVQKKIIFPCQKRKCRISDETLQLVGLPTSAESALAAEGAVVEAVAELEEKTEVSSDEAVAALASEDLPADEAVVAEEESTDEPTETAATQEEPHSPEESANKTAS